MKLLHNILTATLLTALATSCVDEIENGTTDIDSWPLPESEVYLPETFAHPGVVFNQTDIDRWRDIIATQHQPQYGNYLEFKNDRFSQDNYQMAGPFDQLSAGFDPDVPGREKDHMTYIANDFCAAAQNAIMFAATGEVSHAAKALEIIRAYAHTVTKPTEKWGFDAATGVNKNGGRQDHVLMVGNCGVKLVYAIELLYHLPNSGMTEQDFQDALGLCRLALIPVLEKFFAQTDVDWLAIGNFGAAAMNCYISLAIMMDDHKMYEYAVDRYLNNVKYENGCIRNYIKAGSGQCQESGRDQTHAQLGLGMLSMMCEAAWKQGTDLYSALDDRLLLGYEYTARYNLGYTVPFEFMDNLSTPAKLGNSYKWYSIDQQDKEMMTQTPSRLPRRGVFFPVYERVYNHYVLRMGKDAPYVKEVLDTKTRTADFKRYDGGYHQNDVAHMWYTTFTMCGEGYPQSSKPFNLPDDTQE